MYTIQSLLYIGDNCSWSIRDCLIDTVSIQQLVVSGESDRLR